MKSKKKEEKFEYKVPYDIPIFWGVKPTDEEIENIRKTMIGLVNVIKMEARIPQDQIIKDTECSIEVVTCPYTEGYIIKTYTEFSFWCYRDVSGYKVKKLKIPTK